MKIHENDMQSRKVYDLQLEANPLMEDQWHLDLILKKEGIWSYILFYVECENLFQTWLRKLPDSLFIRQLVRTNYTTHKQAVLSNIEDNILNNMHKQHQ